MEESEKENKPKKKSLSPDQWIKIGGLVLALVGTVITVLKFANGTQEVTAPILSEEQKEMYIEVSDAIGQLIAEKENIKSETAQKFNALYSGKMILVEDTIVSLAMRKFKFELDDKLARRENILNPNKFQKTGMDVVKACRNALKNTE